jgi:L-asparaginase II
MSQTQIRPTTRPTARPSAPRARYPKGAAAPVLVEIRRGPIVESRHRGHVVQVNAAGDVEWGIGDPDVVVSMRSSVKPFGVAALVEAGGIDAFNLTEPELAVMAASHNGEDAHVRTVQAMLRRAGLSQSLLACGTEDAPADSMTAARLARDGESPSSIRHMCSGFHTSSLLLSRMKGWSLPDYWQADHPSQLAVRDVVSRVFQTKPANLVTAIDACGVPTYAFPLAAIARAYAYLADPESAPAGASSLVPALTRIRDAMVGTPEMVGGTRESSDTEIMRARAGQIVCKGGAEGLRGIGLFAGARGDGSAAAGVAVKIEDGDLTGRANRSASIEALGQLRALDADALERLNLLHRQPLRDPRRLEIGQVVPTFQLAPISELG